MKPAWFPDWSGETAVIVASGPSALGVNLLAAKGRARVIAVNNSWGLCPWADLLYACDAEWWRTGAGDGFRGLKVSAAEVAGVERVGLKVEPGGWSRAMVAEPAGVIGAGSSSGFQALNLAVQFGARRVVLVGFDCRVDLGTHWHGDHKAGLRNPKGETADRWRKAFDGVAGQLRGMGVEVLNASVVSRLRGYDKVRFESAFGGPLDVIWAAPRLEAEALRMSEMVKLVAKGRIRLSVDRTLRRGEEFEASRTLADRYIAQRLAEPASDKPRRARPSRRKDGVKGAPQA